MGRMGRGDTNVGTWDEFITEALIDQAEPADMAALRKALDSGSELVRVSLNWKSRQEPPRYEVVLYRSEKPNREHFTVQHSESFMRWSLDAHAQLMDRDQESLRTLFLLREQFRKLEDGLGTSYFDSVLVEYLRSLGPLRALTLLSGYDQPLAPASALKDDALISLRETLINLARGLKRLGYSQSDVAEILDKALALYTDERYGLSLRQSLLNQ
jgi:hypothetical protein